MYAKKCMKFAVICSTKYAGICTNKQIRNMQYMWIISINMLKYAKTKYAHICKKTTCINMHKICTWWKNAGEKTGLSDRKRQASTGCWEGNQSGRGRTCSSHKKAWRCLFGEGPKWRALISMEYRRKLEYASFKMEIVDECNTSVRRDVVEHGRIFLVLIERNAAFSPSRHRW